MAGVNSVSPLAGGYSNQELQQFVNTEGRKATYSAAITGLVAGAAANDIFTISGSATTVIKITRISIGGRATASTNMDVRLLKRSTLNTGGTSTSPARTPHDSTSAAATAVVKGYTGNTATLGTLVGTVRARQVPIGDLTTTLAQQHVINFGELNGQCPTLRGTSQLLAINLNGGTYSGNLLDIDVEWTEEALVGE